MKRVFSIALKIIASLFIAYAVIFSIAGSYLLYRGARYVLKPVRQVKHLALYNPRQTSYMAHYRQDLKEAGKPDSLSQIFVPLDSISTYLQEAVVASEDDGFYIHPGVDLEAIISANDYNLRYKKIKRGGSTITQQIAKNIFLNNDRNFERKYMELAYSLLMEKYLGKRRILELYLNYAQWGANLFGCEAASRFYFKKPCSQLNRNEAIRLAAVLASPAKLSPMYSQSTVLAQRIQVIANNLYSHHQINDSGYRSITGTPPPLDSSIMDSLSIAGDSSGIATMDGPAKTKKNLPENRHSHSHRRTQK
jgi:monofunctional biosynthetic peptidoglycan transglycosylase